MAIEFDRHFGMLITINIHQDGCATMAEFISKLAGIACEAVPSDEFKALISSNGHIGVNGREIDLIVLAAAEVGDYVAIVSVAVAGRIVEEIVCPATAIQPVASTGADEDVAATGAVEKVFPSISHKEIQMSSTDQYVRSCTSGHERCDLLPCACNCEIAFLHRLRMCTVYLSRPGPRSIDPLIWPLLAMISSTSPAEW